MQWRAHRRHMLLPLLLASATAIAGSAMAEQTDLHRAAAANDAARITTLLEAKRTRE